MMLQSYRKRRLNIIMSFILGSNMHIFTLIREQLAVAQQKVYNEYAYRKRKVHHQQPDKLNAINHALIKIELRVWTLNSFLIHLVIHSISKIE